VLVGCFEFNVPFQHKTAISETSKYNVALIIRIFLTCELFWLIKLMLTEHLLKLCLTFLYQLDKLITFCIKCDVQSYTLAYAASLSEIHVHRQS